MNPRIARITIVLVHVTSTTKMLPSKSIGIEEISGNVNGSCRIAKVDKSFGNVTLKLKMPLVYVGGEHTGHAFPFNEALGKTGGETPLNLSCAFMSSKKPIVLASIKMWFADIENNELLIAMPVVGKGIVPEKFTCPKLFLKIGFVIVTPVMPSGWNCGALSKFSHSNA